MNSRKAPSGCLGLVKCFWRRASIAELVCATGIVQRRLSNGMKINYCQTDNEPQAAMVRMVAAGGRAMEGQGAGPLGHREL